MSENIVLEKLSEVKKLAFLSTHNLKNNPHFPRHMDIDRLIKMKQLVTDIIDFYNPDQKEQITLTDGCNENTEEVCESSEWYIDDKGKRRCPDCGRLRKYH